MVELAPDFDEFFDLLIARGVEILVVGDYALAIHGAPRFTGDIDVFIRPTLDNAERLLGAVTDFGFPTAGVSGAELIDPARLLQMGVEPVQIHVMSAISGVAWDDAWTGRVTARCDSHDVPFLGRRELNRNKQASGRLQDRADLEALGERE